MIRPRFFPKSAIAICLAATMAMIGEAGTAVAQRIGILDLKFEADLMIDIEVVEVWNRQPIQKLRQCRG